MIQRFLIFTFVLWSSSAFATNPPCALVDGGDGSVRVVLTRGSLTQIDSCRLVRPTGEYKCTHSGRMTAIGKDIRAQLDALPEIVGVAIYENNFEGLHGYMVENCVASHGSFEK